MFLVSGVFVFPWRLKDLACVLPPSCFPLMMYIFGGGADGYAVFAKHSGSWCEKLVWFVCFCFFFLCAHFDFYWGFFCFCKGDDMLYLWKLILWVEFLSQDHFV